ncbi:hypothetical protein L6452_00840 [Arctium lappa]|uniref:Uncharacterized protein n=1 Tax=Arctium lappa TaxID=4217 RepID=A0ACB9FEZ4_ARCLA|nr:hypothetical protein L6452_00840 [Arctium lappa]
MWILDIIVFFLEVTVVGEVKKTVNKEIIPVTPFPAKKSSENDCGSNKSAVTAFVCRSSEVRHTSGYTTTSGSKVLVDQVKYDIPRVIRQRPVVKSWSLDKLRIREAEELANGGFGLGDFAEPYVGNVGCVDGAGTSLQGMTPKNDIQDLNETYKQLTTLKTEFEKTLDAASVKYLKASEITEWRRKHFVLFGIDVNSIEGQPQPGDEPNDGAEQVILGSDGKVDENREFETPTQFFQYPDVIPAVDVAIWEEMSRKKGTTSSALPLDSIPSFSLGWVDTGV